MVLNAFRIRLALMAAGVLTLCLYLMAGGRLGPRNEGTIQIEYGMYPEAFEGLQVAIDDEPAGALKSIGAATRAAFPVRAGRHEVRVVSSHFACRSRTLTIESGQTVMLVLDVGGSSGPNGEGKPEIYLQ